MTPIYLSDLDPPGKPRPKGKIPYPPDRDATVPQLRDWLSNAMGLPPEVRVDAVTRAGRDPDDALTIVLSNGIAMRCAVQKRLQQPRTLQAFLASESDGIAQPAYLSPAEAGDAYVVLCRLGTACERHDPIADLLERLSTFVQLAEELHGTLLPEGRYKTIEAIRARPAFERGVAIDMRNGQPQVVPVVLVDAGAKRHYIRASEWMVYLRFCVGMTFDEGRLPSIMGELGSDRLHPQAWNADRSHKTHLVFYTVPENL